MKIKKNASQRGIYKQNLLKFACAARLSKYPQVAEWYNWLLKICLLSQFLNLPISSTGSQDNKKWMGHNSAL